MVKGTTKGTIADNDGRFSLTGVKKGDTIHISYIGYKTVNVTWTGNALNVVLEEDTNTFDEVVVTGYGTNNSYYDVAYANSERGKALLAGGSLTMTDPYTGQQIAYNDYAGVGDEYVFNDAAFSQDHHFNIGGQ